MSVIIKGKNLNLRMLRKSDEYQLQNNANDRAISRYITVPYPYTVQMARQFIAQSQSELKKKKAYHLGIMLKESDDFVGMMGLMHINKENKNAEIGYWVGRKFWGRGIATEALDLMLSFGFKNMKLERIYARVMHPNEVSAKLLERAGFQYEGRTRRTTVKNGKWMDDLLYSILRTEFYKRTKRT